MEDLLHVVSHDLRAPLINVQGFSKRLEPLMKEITATLDQVAVHSGQDGLRAQVQTLKDQAQSRFAESLRFISKGVEKMDTLLSLLLAISRVGRKADPIQPHDLDTILDDVLATFDHQLQERALRVIRHPLPKRIPCRRNEINQVFSNLLANAINYMGPSQDRFIEIGADTRDNEVECYIRDTGIGMAPEDHERVFQMFTRLQAIDVPGEGVGLAYVRKILRSHGGRIRVVSAKGQGSTFFFTLPMARETAAARG
jgi:signal transduction histidine kinase